MKKSEKTSSIITVASVIITKDEEKKIEDCLKSVVWTDEIIVVDTGSRDNTPKISRKYTDKFYQIKGGNYADWRNFGMKKVTSDWIFYIDSDERCNPDLKNEIKKVISSNDPKELYVIPRKNIILGHEMKHGGWWPDYVKRLFKKESLVSWSGELHEEPLFKGEMGYLKSPLIHLKHGTLSEMLAKTNLWSNVEAKLMYDANHPPMNNIRFLTAMGRELWKRLFLEKGFLDGAEGVIYSFYQMYSKFISYAKLWEMQENKS